MLAFRVENCENGAIFGLADCRVFSTSCWLLALILTLELVALWFCHLATCHRLIGWNSEYIIYSISQETPPQFGIECGGGWFKKKKPPVI